jgi:hypothetical protein
LEKPSPAALSVRGLFIRLSFQLKDKTIKDFDGARVLYANRSVSPALNFGD